LKISTMGLGTANFGWLTDEKDSFAMLDAALDRGINFIDTSDNYNAGKTESLLGRYLTAEKRNQIVLATKCYTPPTDFGSSDPVKASGSWVGPNDWGLSAKHIREACEASLKRLNVDYIDLYQMHHLDRSAPLEEIWQAMDLLIQQGKILYVGGSNFPGWYISKANEIAKQRHLLGLTSEQSVYNLTQRTIELEVIPACREYNMALTVYSPVGGGLLAGADDGGIRRQFAQSEQHKNQLEDYAALCAELGETPAEVAIAWVRSNPQVTAPIIGPRTMQHLESALHAAEIKLDAGVLEKLDKLFPGPGGEAPEAYTW
jgi:aryl-alcohol dehydrogenase-like predicted oxidoreductase